MEINFRQLIENRIIETNKKLDALENLLTLEDFKTHSVEIFIEKLPEELSFGKFSPLECSEDLDLISSQKAYVYYFQILNLFDRNLFFTEFDLCKKKGLCNCCYKPKNAENNESNYLYVGSVKKGFNTRLKQHLGYGKMGQIIKEDGSINKGTGSLHLKKWCPKTILLRLSYTEISNQNLTTDLESELAKILKPLLGRHNN